MRIALLAFIGLLSGTALAADGSEDRALTLTIYNKNLALVEHVRPLKLAAGRQRVEFAGVSAQILPETVSFDALNLELIEQNFDYDLLTPEKLMEKAIGGKVRLVHTNPATGAETSEIAEVLSTSGGTVLRIGSRIEVLRDDSLPTRVIFDKVPDNLRARPTLSVLVNAEQPIDQEVKLTYLTRGLSWDADYVAVFDEAKATLSMQGWITLTNESGTTFTNARAQLVAGDLNISDSEESWLQKSRINAQRAAGTESGTAQRLGDYYTYPIKQPTTIANQQNKQVSFLESANVKASKGYEISFSQFESSDNPASAQVRVRFSNSKAAGLGEQMPSGVVRVYARDARGQPQFIGEDRIGHTSAGSEIALRIGDAFDVTVTPTLTQTTKVNKRTTDYQMSYLARNAKPTPVVLTLRQDDLWRTNEIREESIKSRRTDADSFAWDVPVPANGETTLTFTLRQGW
ncbi:MAG TPA: DUF4139 domain-containing protein [Steroidobacteraceae bacterium]|jgi:hypothetical protein|nr:DUF4139 domain-containing protein [Steroidobacteraceae bacterium]